ncbi:MULTISPECIES: FAD-dependent oxidoreductase [unclassified Streptosporangium]|uniref:FAD-dependent oxidoreductase n=1 Tax=unclassified Streptosporangium TaxID=2632669 RepID=UPI002E2C15CA|nr:MULTISPECIES: NAD(P)/FAD-dependent oxidoreductase [unclassified Streptosporangium]
MTTALIIGGGVAGPVAAMALQKAGIEPRVFEAYDKSAEGIGANLVLAVNGRSALLELGITTALDAGFDIPYNRYFMGSGRRLSKVANGKKLDDGTVSRAVKRGDLYGALRDEALRRDIHFEFGMRFIGAENTADGVVARFENGTEVHGDLLIGADGLHSTVRTIIDPDAPKPRYGKLINTGGYARDISVPGEPGTEFMYLGKRCFFCYIHHPNGEIWWYAAPSWPNEPSREELASITREDWRAHLCELFAKDNSPAVDIIKATPEIWAPWPINDLPTVPRWSNGRMLLIGDSVHAVSPTAGQGASMAIEDSVVLGKCLRDIPDIPEAMATFERIRRPRVEKVVSFGRRAGDLLIVGSQARRRARDLVMPLFFKRIALNEAAALSWVYDHRIPWDEPISPQPAPA